MKTKLLEKVYDRPQFSQLLSKLVVQTLKLCNLATKKDFAHTIRNTLKLIHYIVEAMALGVAVRVDR